MSGKTFVHPYIPNSEPSIKKELLDACGMKSVEDIYVGIPEACRYKGSNGENDIQALMAIPEDMNKPGLISEYTAERWVKGLLKKNRNAEDNICFLGGGTWNHYVPAVVETIMERDELLTAYVGDAYTDHGKFQTMFEFTSQVGDLTGFDAVCTPCYDWANATAIACRMASRMTGRKEILYAGNVAPDHVLIIKNYCKPEITVTPIAYDKATGKMDLDDLKAKLNDNVAAVYFQNPTYVGTLEDQAPEICSIAKAAGASPIVGVDPTSLGVMAAPAEYGADYVTGDVQPLGLPMAYGGGLGGFIATFDTKEYLGEFPSLLYGVIDTEKEGEYGFTEVLYERTSYAKREKGKDFIGTTTALHGEVAAVYCALMGPQGFKELGEGIFQRVAYTKAELSKIPGVKIPLPGLSYCDFLVDFNDTGKTVEEINKALLDYNILGGKDMSDVFPEYGQSALYAVTECITEGDIKALTDALSEILA